MIKILASLIAVIAILVGVMLIINVNSIGARIIGLIGAASGVIAIYRVVNIIPKLK
jgi:hypothetical protein